MPNLTTEKQICQFYDDVITRLNLELKTISTRAKGGLIRSVKGTLVADITEAIVKIAWKEKGGSPYEISFNQKREILCVAEDYIKRQTNPVVQNFLKDNRKKGYGYSVDKHVFIGGELKLAIECKAYAENAMLKRILFDFSLLKKTSPNMRCALIQLESMLGGDYGSGNESPLGSIASHALMSQFNFDLYIITLLEGEREVQKPVHDPKYFKKLDQKLVRIAIDKIKLLLPNG